MTDVDKARQLFREAGLAFPTIPEELATQLQEQGRWLFSTRPLEMSPYHLQHYVHELEAAEVRDYAVLAHSGHGVNSYAIQYYLVQGSLRMLLHLGWGGVYSDAKADAAKILDCFLMADKIVDGCQKAGELLDGQPLTVVGSDFYGSYWLAPAESRRNGEHDSAERERIRPRETLTQVLGWLTRFRARHTSSIQ